MKRLTAALLLTVVLAALTCSVACAAQGDIWLAGYLLLTLKTPANAKAFAQRIDAVQARANDLLVLSDTLPTITVKTSRGQTNIMTDGKIFLTVTPADAQAARTSVGKLANQWAQRLRKILPEATPIKH